MEWSRNHEGKKIIELLPNIQHTCATFLLILNLVATVTNSGNNRFGYIGLQNQGTTCFLNALLQTFYMTPEFRNQIFRCYYIGHFIILTRFFFSSNPKQSGTLTKHFLELFGKLANSDTRAIVPREIATCLKLDPRTPGDPFMLFCNILEVLELEWRQFNQTRSPFEELYRHCLILILKNKSGTKHFNF